MIRLGGALVYLICDGCEDAIVTRPATAELVAATSAAMGAIYMAATLGIEEPLAVREERAAAMSRAAAAATGELPAGWTREIDDGWPRLSCAVCSSLEGRPGPIAAGISFSGERGAGGNRRRDVVNDDSKKGGGQ